MNLVLTVDETAEILRVSRDTVYSMCAAGDLDHRRCGRRIIVPRRAVLEFLGLEEGAAPADEAGAGDVIAVGAAERGRHVQAT